MSSTHTIAPDDIVATFAEAESNARAPLVVTEPLTAFLDERGLGEGELDLEPVGDGHSNVTYAVRRGGERFVLRRPPRPPLPPSAHDVLREARVLSATAGRARVPVVLAVCDDEAVIGAPFYVMEFVDGDVLTDDVPAALDTPEERARISTELIDALAEVHAVDWQSCGLEGFGKPTGYLERQLRRFGGLWEHNKTREIPQVETVGAWLRENLPDQQAATIVHGDFRLGNMIYAAGAPARLVAILDWEMATIGDPLADVGYLCTLWVDRDDPPLGQFELNAITRREGFPSRADAIQRYAARTGFEVAAIGWHQVFAAFKLAVIIQQIYIRYVRGQTQDQRFRQYYRRVLGLADKAHLLAAI